MKERIQYMNTKTQLLKTLIREEVRRQLTESLTVTDWDEYVKPDYVLIKLSNGKSLKVDKKRVKGGARAYQMLLMGLDGYNDNKKAKQFIDSLVNQMTANLG